MNKTLLKSLRGESFFPRPLWFMRQAGRYLPEYRALRQDAGSFLDLCFNPILASEVTLQPLKRFPHIDGAILFSDILVVPLALGYGVDFIKGEGPKLEKVNLKALNTLNLDTFLKALSPIFETIQQTKEKLEPHKTLLGFAGAPWTVATYMIQGGGSKDQQGAKEAAFSNPEAFDDLITLLVESTVLYLKQQVSAGVDALQIFDSWSGVLPEPYYDRWVVRPIQAIIQRLKTDYPETPIIVFPKGNASFYGKWNFVDALSLDSTTGFKTLPPALPLQGGLDPQILLAGGKALFEEAHRILEATKDRPYIFNLGHGMTPNIPVQHVHDLIEFVKEWRP